MPTPLAQNLLARTRRTVEIEVDGEAVTVTVRRVSAADMIQVGGELLTAYGALGNLAKTMDRSDADGYAITRAVLLAGVVDPPLKSDRSATELCPEDIPIEGWPKLFQVIAELSDLEGLFRRIGEAAGGAAAAVRPGPAAAVAGGERGDGPLDGVHDLEPGTAGLQPERADPGA